MPYQGHDTFKGAPIGFHKAEQLMHASTPSFDLDVVRSSGMEGEMVGQITTEANSLLRCLYKALRFDPVRKN